VVNNALQKLLDGLSSKFIIFTTTFNRIYKL
jgi:hypothetical protein